MRYARLVRVSVVALCFGCASGPAETWHDATAGAGHQQRNAFCDAHAVLMNKCVRCHSDPPRYGAPFALDTYAATQEAAPSSKRPDRIRAEQMIAAVESGFMPYTALALDPPVEPLTCEEKATLLAWLKSPTPPPEGGEGACADRAPEWLECVETGAAGANSD
jgi:hypothetical protein